MLRAIARSEPVATREVSRLAELPVPIVTAVCNELRKRGVVDRARPVRLTEAGRAALHAPGPGGGHSALSGRCPACDGRGVVIPDAAATLAAELDRRSAGIPGAKLDLDQTHCTVDTKIRRVLRMHEAGALDGKAIILLGDDDLISVALALFCALPGSAARIRRLAVLDTDADLLACIGGQLAGGAVPGGPVPSTTCATRCRPGWPASSTWRAPTRRTRWPAPSCSCPARWPRWPPTRASTCSSRSAPAARRRPCAPRS